MDKHRLKLFQKKLGGRLMAARQANNLTQAKVASTGIIRQSHLSKIETGELLPNVLILKELADFYKVDLLKLIEHE